jgi:hypothetical protein
MPELDLYLKEWINPLKAIWGVLIDNPAMALIAVLTILLFVFVILFNTLSKH